MTFKTGSNIEAGGTEKGKEKKNNLVFIIGIYCKPPRTKLIILTTFEVALN
jgi:hypothetical protein